MGIPQLSLVIETEVSADSRNYGLINSAINQTFHNGINFGSLVFAALCILSIIGAMFIYTIYRDIANHGRTLACHSEALHYITARHSAVVQQREED